MLMPALAVLAELRFRYNICFSQGMHDWTRPGYCGFMCLSFCSKARTVDLGT